MTSTTPNYTAEQFRAGLDHYTGRVHLQLADALRALQRAEFPDDIRKLREDVLRARVRCNAVDEIWVTIAAVGKPVGVQIEQIKAMRGKGA